MQKLRVELYCDRCENGVQAERTVGFGVDDEAGKRREYKIELCNMHLKEFVTDIEPWLSCARPEDKPGRQRRGSPTTARPTGMSAKTNHGPARRDPEQLAGIRAWARANGYQVSDKGRIPAEVEEAYNRNAQTG
ncbi:MAG: histone-like nucleoid-structuring protein Lsr2 [Acidimicrobiales bacterium]